MKFKGPILLLAVSDKSFLGRDGAEVKYAKVTFITENGEVVSMGTSPELLDTYKGQARLQGVADFELSADFKGNPKVKMTSFTPDKGK